MSSRTFPIIWGQHTREEVAIMGAAGCPRAVPWDFVAPHRERCLKNHDQTPERLAERGGLCPREMLAVVTDQRWSTYRGVPLRNIVLRLRELLDAWTTTAERRRERGE